MSTPPPSLYKPDDPYYKPDDVTYADVEEEELTNGIRYIEGFPAPPNRSSFNGKALAPSTFYRRSVASNQTSNESQSTKWEYDAISQLMDDSNEMKVELREVKEDLRRTRAELKHTNTELHELRSEWGEMKSILETLGRDIGVIRRTTENTGIKLYEIDRNIDEIHSVANVGERRLTDLTREPTRFTNLTRQSTLFSHNGFPSEVSLNGNQNEIEESRSRNDAPEAAPNGFKRVESVKSVMTAKSFAGSTSNNSLPSSVPVRSHLLINFVNTNFRLEISLDEDLHPSICSALRDFFRSVTSKHTFAIQTSSDIPYARLDKLPRMPIVKNVDATPMRENEASRRAWPVYVFYEMKSDGHKITAFAFRERFPPDRSALPKLTIGRVVDPTDFPMLKSFLSSKSGGSKHDAHVSIIL